MLMGVNTRTYKFALGEALLAAARQGRTELPLADLAAAYSMSLLRHADHAPQASLNTAIGERDYLQVAKEEASASLAAGEPTERLLNAAMGSMPAMVMQKFHNLRGGTAVPDRFYEVTGSPRERMVVLTPALRKVVESSQVRSLSVELAARWAIVESSFDTGIGRSLVNEGVTVDLDTWSVLDKHRRRRVTGVADAVIGFQHGRCLICNADLLPTEAVAVDHVFPWSMMRMGGVGTWLGPDLDAVWNLAPAHARCNGGKSNRPPTREELQRLALRNAAIMASPYPLRTTLALTLAAYRAGSGREEDWVCFLDAVGASV